MSGLERKRDCQEINEPKIKRRKPTPKDGREEKRKGKAKDKEKMEEGRKEENSKGKLNSLTCHQA